MGCGTNTGGTGGDARGVEVATICNSFPGLFGFSQWLIDPWTNTMTLFDYLEHSCYHKNKKNGVFPTTRSLGGSPLFPPLAFSPIPLPSWPLGTLGGVGGGLLQYERYAASGPSSRATTSAKCNWLWAWLISSLTLYVAKGKHNPYHQMIHFFWGGGGKEGGTVIQRPFTPRGRFWNTFN